MRPLAIVAYFEGRPGHEKQTRAVLDALARLTDTTVTEKKVPVDAKAYVRNWAAFFLAFLGLLKRATSAGPADMIIGTGTHTHIPMLLDKKARKRTGNEVRLVTCMGPDTLLRSEFDLCFIPMHDEPETAPNVFVTLGPPSPLEYEHRHEPDRGLILVGGIDRKSHRWETSRTVDQIQRLIAQSPSLLWTISSSPRTPEDTCQALETLAGTIPQVEFFRSIDTPSGWVEEQYARNGTVWVTADSVSMVYEALAAGCSVGILPVEWLRQNNKFQKSLHILQERKKVVGYEEWLSGQPMPEPVAEPCNEAARCAKEILKRWWPARLQ